MTELTYTGSAAVWRTARAGGINATPGETVTIGDDVENKEAVVEWLTSQHDFERTPDADVEGEDEDAPPAEAESEEESESEAPGPLDGTVPEIKDALATGEYDDDLVDLYNAERDGENRSTAIEAIQDRRDELREQNTESEE